MLIRVLISIGVCALGVGVYWLWNGWLVARLRRRQVALPGLETLRTGTPAILYFTTPDCAPCQSVQRPALARLQTELGDRVQIIEIDARAQPRVADYWGVLAVPTTFIIDGAGRPRRVNHGITSTEKLRRQLVEMGDGPSAQDSRHKKNASLSLEP